MPPFGPETDAEIKPSLDSALLVTSSGTDTKLVMLMAVAPFGVPVSSFALEADIEPLSNMPPVSVTSAVCDVPEMLMAVTCATFTSVPDAEMEPRLRNE